MKTTGLTTLAAVVLLSVAGCRYDEVAVTGVSGDVIETPYTFGSGPEQIWIDKAKENFRHGEYGLAESNYRQAIDIRRNNAEAWLGLAASYDHLKRFDEADRAYEVLNGLTGTTAAYLNNLGYHNMLKGDFTSAEHALRAAQERDPYNLLIRTNLALLADWKAAAGRPG